MELINCHKMMFQSPNTANFVAGCMLWVNFLHVRCTFVLLSFLCALFSRVSIRVILFKKKVYGSYILFMDASSETTIHIEVC